MGTEQHTIDIADLGIIEANIDSIKLLLENDKQQLESEKTTIEGFGTGTIDLKVIELLAKKSSISAKEYKVLQLYAKLLDAIYVQIMGVDSSISSEFKDWSNV